MSHHPQIYSRTPGSSLWYRKVKSCPKKVCKVQRIPSVRVSFVMTGIPELLIKSLTATVRALRPLSSCFTPLPALSEPLAYTWVTSGTRYSTSSLSPLKQQNNRLCADAGFLITLYHILSAVELWMSRWQQREGKKRGAVCKPVVNL